MPSQITNVIIGSSVGGAVVACLVLGAVVYVLTRRKNHAREVEELGFTPATYKKIQAEYLDDISRELTGSSSEKSGASNQWKPRSYTPVPLLGHTAAPVEDQLTPTEQQQKQQQQQQQQQQPQVKGPIVSRTLSKASSIASTLQSKLMRMPMTPDDVGKGFRRLGTDKSAMTAARSTKTPSPTPPSASPPPALSHGASGFTLSRVPTMSEVSELSPAASNASNSLRYSAVSPVTSVPPRQLGGLRNPAVSSPVETRSPELLEVPRSVSSSTKPVEKKAETSSTTLTAPRSGGPSRERASSTGSVGGGKRHRAASFNSNYTTYTTYTAYTAYTGTRQSWGQQPLSSAPPGIKVGEPRRSMSRDITVYAPYRIPSS